MEKNAKQAQKDIDAAVKGDKPNHPPGNAYGKDKGGLEGLEFGQNRAAEAHSKNEMKMRMQQNIDQAEQIHQDVLAKIQTGINLLEKKYQAKQIAEADYQAKKKAFKDLEERAKELQQRNEELRTKLE